MRFRCGVCGEEQEGMPAFGWDFPVHYLAVPETDRPSRTVLTSDTCEIDGRWFFVRGCLEIPVLGEAEAFSWGVWASLSEPSYRQYRELYDIEPRAGQGPYFGWLASHIAIYPGTINLKTRVHLRDGGIRPFVELEPTDHPLAVEQRTGITIARVQEIFERIRHPAAGPG